MRGSRLPQGGENVLQTIRGKRAEAEASGIKLLDLSIGEPKGPALRSWAFKHELVAVGVLELGVGTPGHLLGPLRKDDTPVL